MLARGMERSAACHENAHAVSRSKEVSDQRRRFVDGFEVVEEQQQLPVPQGGDEGLGQRLVRLLFDAHGPGDRGRHEHMIGERCEVDEEDAVGEHVREVVCRLEREPRLADRAHPGHRHESSRVGANEPGELGELHATSDQRGRRSREVPSGAKLRSFDPENGVLAEDRLLELSKLEAWVEA